MKIKLKWIVLLEAVIIVILAVTTISLYTNKLKVQSNQEIKQSLLSPRIHVGLLEPESFMIVNFNPLKEEIQAYITKNNLNVSVYVENFRNGAFMGINEKTGFYPASLGKLPVAIEIVEKIERGDLSFDTMLSIQDSDRDNTSGSLYNVKAKELPLRVILEKLLRESDNTALRIFFRYIDPEDFKLILDYYGIEIGSVKDEKGQRHLRLISPKVMSTLYSSLYFSTVLEPQNSEYLLTLLTDTVLDINKLAKIPDEVKIAHKYGENYYSNQRFFHDCGILYINESRIFYCIMTKDIDERKAKETIGFIVNEVYIYIKNTKAKLQDYKKQRN